MLTGNVLFSKENWFFMGIYMTLTVKIEECYGFYTNPTLFYPS